MILNENDIKLTDKEKKDFEKEKKHIAKKIRKIMKEKDRRLVALLSLICEKENIKPSDLCFCVEQKNESLVKMYFKKKEQINEF